MLTKAPLWRISIRWTRGSAFKPISFPQVPKCLLNGLMKCYRSKNQVTHRSPWTSHKGWTDICWETTCQQQWPWTLDKHLKLGRAVDYLMLGSLHWNPIMERVAICYQNRSITSIYNFPWPRSMSKLFMNLDVTFSIVPVLHCTWGRNLLLSLNQ